MTDAHAMRRHGFAYPLFLQAATPFSLTPLQIVVVGSCRRTTEARTEPVDMSVRFSFGFFDHGQSAKDLAWDDTGIFHDAPPSGCPRERVRGNLLGQAFELHL